jgi:hypothetical protein
MTTKLSQRLLAQHRRQYDIQLPLVQIDVKKYGKSKTTKQDLLLFRADDERWVYLPWRYINTLDISSNTTLNDTTLNDTLYTDTDQSSSIVLRDHQKPWFTIAYDTLTKHHTALLSIKTGGGKTIVAIAIAQYMVSRGLITRVTILVHRNILLDQWMDRIKQFAPELEPHIRVINICSVEKYFTSDSNACTSSFTDLLIVDEAHLFCSDIFFYRLLRCDCTYALALTATPERDDGRHILLTRLFGEPVVYTRVKQTFTVYVYHTLLSFNLHMNHVGVQWTSMLKEQSEHIGRTQLVVQVVKLLVSKGYIPLVLSKFINHCELLHDALSLCGKVVHAKQGTSIPSSNEYDIIVGTFTKCGTGFDAKVNALVLASDSTGTFEQTLGRVFRTQLPPIIIDFVDTGDDHGVWYKHLEKRLFYYDTCGGTVKHVHGVDEVNLNNINDQV